MNPIETRAKELQASGVEYGAAWMRATADYTAGRLDSEGRFIESNPILARAADLERGGVPHLEALSQAMREHAIAGKALEIFGGSSK